MQRTNHAERYTGLQPNGQALQVKKTFNFAVDKGERCLQTYSLGFEIVSNEKH